ncbi:MAG: arsenate reductase, partial [Oceanospirillum sp.]|nr:arsenate reductase [Oceanospirillum sp.]
MPLTLYGIPNCDTVKKARTWLENNQLDYQFHDFRKDGLSESDLTLWCDALGWEQVLNKRSTSWR